MAFKIESNLLDACALAILKRGDTYGYEITQEMKKAITVSESTLYPVLRRLQKEGLCRTYDQPFQGRNRRYYSITERGEKKLHEYRKQWDDYRNAIQRLMDGEADLNNLPDEEGTAEKSEYTAGSRKEEEYVCEIISRKDDSAGNGTGDMGKNDKCPDNKNGRSDKDE